MIVPQLPAAGNAFRQGLPVKILPGPAGEGDFPMRVTYLAHSGFLVELPSVTLGDLLFNYEHHIVADCADHRRYAVNQFSGLESYLNEKESAFESSTV